ISGIVATNIDSSHDSDSAIASTLTAYNNAITAANAAINGAQNIGDVASVKASQVTLVTTAANVLSAARTQLAAKNTLQTTNLGLLQTALTGGHVAPSESKETATVIAASINDADSLGTILGININKQVGSTYKVSATATTTGVITVQVIMTTTGATTPESVAKTLIVTHISDKLLAEQVALNDEQDRINLLSSSGSMATSINTPANVGSIFNSAAQAKYGISLEGAAVGYSFTYTYVATISGVTITVGLSSVSLTPVSSAILIGLNPTPAANTKANADKEAQDILDAEQTRVNQLLSTSATATTFGDAESGDLDLAAQAKYGISGIHEINNRDEFIAYLRSQGQIVDAEGLEYQHLTVPITLNIDGNDIVHPIGSSFTVNWKAGDKVTVLYWTNSEGDQEALSTRFINQDIPLISNPVFVHKVIIPNNKFTYTYVATKTGLKIKVGLVAHNTFVSTISPKNIILSPTRAVNAAALTVTLANAAKETQVIKTNEEQARVNGLHLTSDQNAVTGSDKPTGFTGLTENSEFVYTYSFVAPTGITMGSVIIKVVPKTLLNTGSATTPITATTSITIYPSALVANAAKEVQVVKTNEEQARVNGMHLTADKRAATGSQEPAGFSGLTENSKFVYTYHFIAPQRVPDPSRITDPTGNIVPTRLTDSLVIITVTPKTPLNIGSATTPIAKATPIIVHLSKVWFANQAKEAQIFKTNKEQERVNGLHLTSDQNAVTGPDKPTGFAGLTINSEFVYTYSFRPLLAYYFTTPLDEVKMGEVLITVTPKNPLTTGIATRPIAYPTWIPIHPSASKLQQISSSRILIKKLLDLEQERVNTLT
ncbi:MAG: hypothetical protein KAG14_03905, partial [Mycoplasmataceae bacterium]|nr:hypothetical protein [Mycoplasmataceae bacterium]